MLTTLDLRNFTVFRDARLEFSPGLNVLVGDNGTGKSHVLQLGFALLQVAASLDRKRPALDKDEDKDRGRRRLAEALMAAFRPDALERLVSHGSAASSVSAGFGQGGILTFSLCALSGATSRTGAGIGKARADEGHRKAQEAKTAGARSPEDHSPDDVLRLDVQAVEQKPGPCFLPWPGDMGCAGQISPAAGRACSPAACARLEAGASARPNRKGKGRAGTARILARIEDMLGVSVCGSGDRLCFVSGGRRREASLAAGGHRQLAQLALLLKTGRLRHHASLFWDDPEAHLNPRLQAGLAELLAELARNVQIILATHSLFLLRELDILKKQGKLKECAYFNLQAGPEGVEVQQACKAGWLGDFSSLGCAVAQAKRYMELIYAEESA